MRIGILTFHFVSNYGAVLQAYALRQALLQLGHDARFIDYQPEYMTSGGSLRLPVSRSALRVNAQILAIRIAHLRARYLTRLDEGFERFRTQHLPTLPQTVRDHGTLGSVMGSVDVIVCGSDQIWNPPLRHGVDLAYFATMAPPHVRRVAYAASFGRDDIEPDHHPVIRQGLQGLHAVGVREQGALGLVSRIGDVTATLVPDPTLLVSDYDAVIESGDSTRTLFMYALRGESHSRRVARRLAARRGLRVRTPFNPLQPRLRSASTPVLSPGEWLGAIRDAEWVVTNSFHGTVFSILFRRPFVALGLPGAKAGLSSRVTSLLGQLGLLERFMPADDTREPHAVIEAPIDWDAVDRSVGSLRQDGVAFLRTALA
jgi:hypothetical protein